jgi:hypothetical protein
VSWAAAETKLSVYSTPVTTLPAMIKPFLDLFSTW